MRTTCSTLLATLCVLAPVAAQELLRQPTLQERVTRIEADVARMETRVGVQSARPADLGNGESGAARDAADARRDAQAAQQSARDAALRR